ncbi:MAG: class I SAM-dependent methyltransferase [Lentisphaeria bacterium]|nr:class I SAM-dependent methyltransferase [Lentisphaeria bacterium]
MYQDIFEKIAFHYDELVREGHDPFQDPPEVQEYMDEWDGEEFLNLLALTGKEKVLEIGCGTGRLAGRVLNLCMEYTGIDLSGASVMRARANLAAVPGTPFRNFLCGQFPDCILPGQYHCIFSSLTLLHIPDKSAAMQKIASHLLPGGRVVLSLDKTRKEDIEYIDRTVPVFPDTPVSIKKACTGTGLQFVSRLEKEKATLLVFAK